MGHFKAKSIILSLISRFYSLNKTSLEQCVHVVNILCPKLRDYRLQLASNCYPIAQLIKH